jgi:urease accessory protein
MIGRGVSFAGVVLGLGAVLAAGPAGAHGLGGGGTGLMAGFAHPFLGLDHAVAMVAVGLWAAQTGGAARWTLPASFLAAMAAGGALGGLGIVLPAVEAGIALSVLALGIAIATAARPAAWAGMALVGAFALFHGHAHGAELPGGASPWLHAAGVLLATAALHAAGLGGGDMLRRFAGSRVARLIGGAISLAGLAWIAG